MFPEFVPYVRADLRRETQTYEVTRSSLRYAAGMVDGDRMARCRAVGIVADHHVLSRRCCATVIMIKKKTEQRAATENASARRAIREAGFGSVAQQKLDFHLSALTTIHQSVLSLWSVGASKIT